MSHERSIVLACIDGSDYTEAVVDYAAWVAKTVEAPLKLLHNSERRPAAVFDLSGSIGLGAREELLNELTELESRRSKIMLKGGKAMLEQAAAKAQLHGLEDISSLQQHGDLTDSLIEMETEIRVLVLGIRGEDHSGTSKTIGAQLETVIRAMHRPVLVVNRPYTKTPERLMLAYDGSEASKKALLMIASSPLYRNMVCHVVHVSHNESAAHPLLSEAVGALGRAGVKVIEALIQGDVVQALTQYQVENDIDLTVMGAFGHTRLRELIFGSLTVNMMTGSTVPMLLLR